MADLRVGLGFDAHPSDPSRPLLLGGVRFEGEAGLAGHSDGDVLCHALADALLGSVGLGDLGDHFPDTAPEIAGIAGLDLLGRTVELVEKEGFAADSCDLVVLAARPRIVDARNAIRGNVAEALGIDPSRVSVKATRPEGLGLRGDGIGCMAIVLARSS